MLFHKGELLDTRAAGLATAVRGALQNAHQRVVRVVVNAVDEHLAKSDQLRLSWTMDQKKQGYHGGATPQEVLVPLAVLVPQHRTLAGWAALPDDEPVWWSQGELPGVDVLSTPARTRHRAGPAPAAQGTLCADMPGHSAETPRQDWMARLLSSPVFAAQRRAAGRRAPDDRLVRALLAALEAQRDRMTHRLLAQVLGTPEFRLRAILTGVQRLLNVDGYQVIAVDDMSDVVSLNRQLLNTQFQLDVV